MPLSTINGSSFDIFLVCISTGSAVRTAVFEMAITQSQKKSYISGSYHSVHGVLVFFTDEAIVL